MDITVNKKKNKNKKNEMKSKKERIKTNKIKIVFFRLPNLVFLIKFSILVKNLKKIKIYWTVLN